jgi:hypothetical protein
MASVVSENKTIDANKVKLAEFLSTPRAFRPMTLKSFARELGVSEPTIHSWKRDPDVIRLSMNKIGENFSRYIPDVVESLKDQAVAGNVNAAKIFLDYVVGKEFEQGEGEKQGEQDCPTMEEVRDVIDKVKSKRV